MQHHLFRRFLPPRLLSARGPALPFPPMPLMPQYYVRLVCQRGQHWRGLQYVYGILIAQQRLDPMHSLCDAACLTPDSVVTQPIIITVIPIVTPTVSISPANTFVCTGSNPVFTAQPVNEGATPTYQWQINGIAIGGTGSTYTAIQPVNGSSITVTLISNAACASPDTVTSSPALLSVDSPLSLSRATQLFGWRYSLYHRHGLYHSCQSHIPMAGQHHFP